MFTTTQKQFSTPLLTWFDDQGRKNLPWQYPRCAYRIWISEIMLQQTQVRTVIPYFNRFVTSFPDVWQLAKADDDQVLAHWSGLGYYSRARNLHKTAKIICGKYNGQFPDELSQLIALPGIGPSTAAAITSQAYNQPTAILDGNVKRVLSRYFLVDGWPEQAATKKRLWQLANECMPPQRCADYTQAIMDLGAICCTARNPSCNHCPLQKTCLAHKQDKVMLYPQKKPTKTLPVKHEQFLLLHTKKNRIYLQKNPPSGLWGGLWCMPSIDKMSCPATYIKKVYALTPLKIDELLFMKHTFSHFHLHISALAIEINAPEAHLTPCPGKWFKAIEINELGLSKPVNDIINHFFNNISTE